jgi:hypothetical protein
MTLCIFAVFVKFSQFVPVVLHSTLLLWPMGHTKLRMNRK